MPSDLVTFTPNSVLDARKAEAERLEIRLNESAETGLASYLTTLWEKAKRAKNRPATQMLANLRARESQYESAHLAAIQAVLGPDVTPVFMQITATKCRAAESWIKDIIFQPGQEPYSIDPTPIPELPEGVKIQTQQQVLERLMQEGMAALAPYGMVPNAQALEIVAQNVMPMVEEEMTKALEELAHAAAEKMGLKISDQFAEGKWKEEVEKLVYDIVTYGTCILKGPVVKRVSVMNRQYDPMTDTFNSKLERRPTPTWERRSPFNIFPSPDSTTAEDGWLFDRISLTRSDLLRVIGLPGYNEKYIREALETHRNGGLKEWVFSDQEKATLENRDSVSLWETEKIDCLEFVGSLPGSLLRDWGVSEAEVPDPEMEYEAVCWKIGRWVIKAMLNPDPTGHRHFHFASFVDNPDSIWGKGIPELIEHAQRLGNAVGRHIFQNVGIASGPQVEVNVDRLAPGASTNLYPWKIWLTTNQGMMEGKAINFYQPPIIVQRLMETYEFCLRLADDDSGVPRYTHGDPNAKGGAETASGMSMLMTQSAKGIKSVIKNIDRGIIESSVRAQFEFNMAHEKDVNIMGDLKIVAKGSSSLIAKEQQTIRRNEFMAQTANPFDMQIIGLKGRAELLRQALHSLEIDPDKIIHEEEAIQAQMLATQQAAMTPGQAPPEKQKEIGPGGELPAGRDFQAFESPKGPRP